VRGLGGAGERTHDPPYHELPADDADQQQANAAGHQQRVPLIRAVMQRTVRREHPDLVRAFVGGDGDFSGFTTWHRVHLRVVMRWAAAAAGPVVVGLTGVLRREGRRRRSLWRGLAQHALLWRRHRRRAVGSLRQPREVAADRGVGGMTGAQKGGDRGRFVADRPLAALLDGRAHEQGDRDREGQHDEDRDPHHEQQDSPAHYPTPPARIRIRTTRCARAQPRLRTAPIGAGRVPAPGLFR
jgi:hypothetical protein